MRNLLTTITLCLFTISSFAQSPSEKAIKMLSDDIASFKANETAESRVIDDGSTRVTRSYTSGEKTLKFKIGIPKTKEEFLSMKGELNEVVDMFQEMADEGKMEMELIQAGDVTGFLSFTEKGGSGNGFIMANDQYLIEINVRGAGGIEDIRNVYKALDFSQLGGSASSTPKASTPKAETKPVTEAEKKMIRMLTDSFGSFKATGAARTGMNDDGAINVSRSYMSGNRTFDLFIEGIAVKEDAQFYKKMANEKITYYQGLSGAEVRVINKEKLQGALFYNSNDNTASLQLVVRNQHYIMGTMRGASSIEDIKGVFQSFDYSLLK